MTPEFWESNVLSYCKRKRVASSNFIGDTFSTVDSRQTSVMGKKFMTIGLWCDSETVEANGLLELYKYIYLLKTMGICVEEGHFFIGYFVFLKPHQE